MEEQDKDCLLQLSRRAIQKYLENNQILVIEEESLSSEKVNPVRKDGALKLSNGVKEKRGVFATLSINNELRGCIGNLEPEKPIYQAVIDNSYAAAFCDPRFLPLTKEEFKKTKIEISILSRLKKTPSFKKTDDFLNYLKKKKPGIFIKKSFNQATFLPQVWEEIKNPADFLSHLFRKAGLAPNEWQSNNGDIEIYEYEVEKLKEK